MSEELKPCPIESAVDEYLDGYVMEGDDGFHQPTDAELFFIKDAFMGLLEDAEFLAAWNRRAPAQPEPAAPTVAEPAMQALLNLRDHFFKLYKDDCSAGYKKWDAARAKVDEAIRVLPASTPPRAALTEFQRMQIIGDEFPLALVDPLVIAKVDAVCLAIEAAHGIGTDREGG